MKLFKVNIRILATLVLTTGILTTSSAQLSSVEAPDEGEKNDSLWKFIFVEDDPVVEMLDELWTLKLWEDTKATYDTNKLNVHGFPPDSIPEYDDLIYESRLAHLDAQSPFDLQYNNTIKGYINLYAKRRRGLTSRALGLSNTYFPLIEQELDRYDLPLEFKYLAIVESALNPNAVSRSGATGLWQFMYRTGLIYKLKVTSYVDMRRDPYKATIAACEYFQFLYSMFGDWNLVLAAYNGGPGTLNRAIRKSGGKMNYWELRPFLPRETQGYVPAFIAVNYIMNYAPEHNLYPVEPKYSFYEVDTVEIKQQVTFEQISAVLEIPMEELKYLNPMYRKGLVPYTGAEPYTIKLPMDKIGDFQNNELSIYSYQEPGDTVETVETIDEVRKIHTVKRGQYLGGIAKQYHCTIGNIKQWNNIRDNRIYPGQKLVVYTAKTSTSTTAAATKPVKTTISGGFKYYTIQPGDTLWEIANKFNGVSVTELRKLNNIYNDRSLKPGMKIKVNSSGT